MISAKFDFDSDGLMRKVGEAVGRMEVEHACPGCGHPLKIRLADAAADRTTVCRGCGKAIQLNDKDGELKRVIEGR